MTGLLRQFVLALAAAAFVVCFWFLHPLDTFAATLTVNTTDDPGTIGDTTLTLREAITVVNSQSTAGLSAQELAQINTSTPLGTNDTIAFNVSGGVQMIQATGSPLPALARAVKIDGATQPSFPTSNIVVDGTSLGSVFQVNNGVTVTLNGLTIQNGTGTTCGLPSDTCGGGVVNQGTLLVTNTTIANNTANNYGGGIDNVGALTVSNSTFSGNQGPIAGSGGGIANHASSTVTVTNSTFSGNSATGGAGGIYNLSGTVTVTNSTFSDNDGGGIASFNGGASVTLTNTIVANSTSGSDLRTSGGGTFSGSNNLIGDGSGGLSAANGNLLGTVGTPLDPLLAPLGDYGGPTQTMALLPGSPAINAGAAVNTGPTGNKVPAADQRSVARVGVPDIGAFESKGFTIVIDDGNYQVTAPGSPFHNQLTVIVTANDPSEPTEGGQVTFAPPASGASAVITGNPAAICNCGDASVDATANGTAGTYSVTASARGAGSVTFSLMNGPAACVVNSTQDPVETGKLTLRDAVMFANYNGCTSNRVTFDNTAFPSGTPKTIVLSTDPNTGDVIPLLDDVTIDGTGHQVIVDGAGTVTIFFVNAFVTVHITGLTLQNGAYDGGPGGGGGAILNAGNLTVTNSTFINNKGFAEAGAIDNFDTLTVINSTFTNNTASDGGAIATGGGPLTVIGSTFTGNTAVDPSTARKTAPSKKLPNRKLPVRKVPATHTGGAIAVFSCGCSPSTATITNSTFSGNSATTDGGAFYNEGELTLTNVTINGNTAASGGGVSVDGSSGGILIATNALIAGNLPAGSPAPDVSGPADPSSLNNLIGNGTGMTGLTDGTNGNHVGTSAAPINPLFGALGTYGGTTKTLPLLPGSLAIDAGTVTSASPGGLVPAGDQRGKGRIGAPDIGAFESQGFTMTASGTPQTAFVNTAFASPLGVTVAPNNAGEPVQGGQVAFAVTPAASGATATLSSAKQPLDASGKASITATANGIGGGPYTVAASATGVPNAAFSLTNVVAAITISPTTLPAGIKGVAYQTTTLTATGGATPYAFSVPANTLPPGLTLATDGTLSGTPTATGTFTFTVTVTDKNNATGTQQYTVSVTAAALVRIVVTTNGANTATLKVGQTAAFTATGVYQDNSTADITTQVTWKADNAVAMVDASGKVTALSAGTAPVTATQGAINGQASVTVTDAATVGVAPAPGGRPGAPGGGTPNPAPPSR